MAPATETARTPALLIARSAWDKIMGYTTQCPIEVNGFGYLKVVDQYTLLLGSADDVFITPQVASIASADVDGTAVALAFDQAFRAGRGQQLRLQWHSHVDLAAYHSGTDMRTIDSYASGGATWMVSMVVNRRGERVARLDIYNPFRTGYLIPVREYVELDEELLAACRGELLTNVRHEVPVGKPRGGAQRTRIVPLALETVR